MKTTRVALFAVVEALGWLSCGVKALDPMFVFFFLLFCWKAQEGSPALLGSPFAIRTPVSLLQL